MRSESQAEAAEKGPYRQPAQAEPENRPYIGGQAVLEGVMMRAPRSFAVVVRRRDGSLHIRERSMKDGRTGAAKIPLIRGVASLVESLKLGSEALRFSAEQMEKDMAIDDQEAERLKKKVDAAKKGALNVLSALGMSIFSLATAADGEAVSSDGKQNKGGKGAMWFMLLVVIAFFIALPQIAATLLNKGLGLGLELQSPAFQAITGGMKLLIVVGYLVMIRRVPDIRRVFQYHGAEHKTISTYEAQENLTVANARAKTTLHPRCGTTFLVMVALVSILVFTAVGSLLPRIHTGKEVLDNVIFFAMKLPFLPVIAAVTFELQRFFARYCTTGPLRLLLWPGFLVQKITTIEPDDQQLEVALASLKATLFRQESESMSEGDDIRYPSYEALLAAKQLRPEIPKAA
jgi:uncharacterized protein YqhQ